MKRILDLENDVVQLKSYCLGLSRQDVLLNDKIQDLSASTEQSIDTLRETTLGIDTWYNSIFAYLIRTPNTLSDTQYNSGMQGITITDHNNQWELTINRDTGHADLTYSTSQNLICTLYEIRTNGTIASATIMDHTQAHILIASRPVYISAHTDGRLIPIFFT